MRIVHVSDCFPPRTGGIESQVSDLATHQAAAGDDVHVFTATPSADGARHGALEKFNGVTVHRMGTKLPFDLPINPLEGPRLFRAAFAELQPDAVHVHAGVVSPFAYDGSRIALDMGLPTVITWHCMLDGAIPAMKAAVRASRWRQAPLALTAVSAASAKRVGEVFNRPVEILPNALHMADWAPKDGHPSEGPLRCVATMRLAPRKRAVPLVRSFARAVAQLPAGSVHLTLIGSGPTERQVRSVISELGLEGVVELAGRLDRTALRDRYAAADVFLAPAELEAFGIAALEARTSGLVILGRTGTGLAEFVTDERDGWLVNDDAELTAAIVRLARDRDLTTQIKAHNQTVRPPFDWADALVAARAQYERATDLSVGSASAM